MPDAILSTREPIPNSVALPSLPYVAARIVHLTREAQTSVKEIADCLSTDPALVQKILRTVNSPLYGLGQKVSNVTQAASLLGANVLRGLVLGFTLPRTWDTGRGTGFSMVTFWRYSLTTAVAARLLAARVGYKDPEEAFVAGLLADIGVLGLYKTVPEEYEKVLALRQKYLLSCDVQANPLAAAGVMCQVEQEVLGTDHARIGAQMLSHGELPEILTLPVRFHHAPAELEDPSAQVLQLTRLLNLAALVSQTFNIAGKRASIDGLEILGSQYFALRRTDVSDILEQIGAAVKQTAELLEIGIGRQPSLSEILQQANAELTNLTLSAERTAQEEARTRGEVQRRARELESLTWELANRANRDPLTGAFNRGFFDNFITEQFDRGKTAGLPIGLILIDIHHFKNVNDTFGHQQGDAVIVELANRLRSNTRNHDVVARYGGDEFAVVLPDVDLVTLQSVARRLQAAVWDHPFPAAGGGSLDMAIGIGAVWVRDYARISGVTQLIASADKLLYASKRERNRTIYLAHT